MKINISLPNYEGDHQIIVDGVEIPPYDQLSLPTETLKEINKHILKNHPTNEYEDLFISIGDELSYREEEKNG